MTVDSDIVLNYSELNSCTECDDGVHNIRTRYKLVTKTFHLLYFKQNNNYCVEPLNQDQNLEQTSKYSVMVMTVKCFSLQGEKENLIIGADTVVVSIKLIDG